MQEGRTASRVSEMARIGDLTVGTTPNLSLHLYTDPSKPRSVEGDGRAPFTVERTAMFSGEKEITDPLEKKIAWILIQYGDWPSDEPAFRIVDNELVAIEIANPRERANEGENFEMIGTLSRVFARYYATQTLDDDGVKQVDAELIPDWFRPLTDKGYKSKTLPLWRFVLEPNRTPETKRAA